MPYGAKRWGAALIDWRLACGITRSELAKRLSARVGRSVPSTRVFEWELFHRFPSDVFHEAIKAETGIDPAAYYPKGYYRRRGRRALKGVES